MYFCILDNKRALMKRIFFIFLLVNFSFSAYSQINTIDLKAVFKGKYRLETYNYTNWKPNSDQFAYVDSKNNTEITLFDAKTGKKTVLVTIKDLVSLFPKKHITEIPSFKWIDEKTLYFPRIQALLHLTEDGFTGDTIPFFDGEIISSDILARLFVIKENDGHVFVLSGKNNFEKILLCPDTGNNIVFGESVHRSEWGIQEGQYLSPRANYIAFYRMDESMVEDYPLVNTSTPIATLNRMKYPMAGRNSHIVTLGVFDVNQSVLQKKSVFHYLHTEKEDGEFLTNVTFSPDERFIYISHLNREQNHLKLIEYSVVSGEKTRVILEESDARYVEPDSRMIFLKNNRFIWQSDRDGWNHCYLYDFSGKMLKQITKGAWEVIEVSGLDKNEQFLYFITNKDNPTDRYLYCVNLKTGVLLNLTPEQGTHKPLFSSDCKYFIDFFENLTTPQNIYFCSSDGKKRELLLTSNNPYTEHALGTTSIFSIKNHNGDNLYCRLIFPPDFDKSKKYPCLVYVYGGPHSQMVTNTFMSGGVFLNYLAQKGFVVFCMDNRGTANRGADFEKAIHRQLGVLEMEDQLCGIQHLKSLPYIDTTNIGIDGWSYGGFMVLSLITHYPEIFKAASCGGPVVDWRWYEVMYGERYMDTPLENPEGYNKSSILPAIKNLQCPLLVMHGAQDHSVVWQNSLELIDQAVKDGVQIDYFVYPSHDHNVRGIDRVYLWKKLELFYLLHLKNNLLK